MNASELQSRIRLGEGYAAHHKTQDNLLEEKVSVSKNIFWNKTRL